MNLTGLSNPVAGLTSPAQGLDLPPAPPLEMATSREIPPSQRILLLLLLIAYQDLVHATVQLQGGYWLLEHHGR